MDTEDDGYFGYTLGLLPDYGIYHLRVDEAAELIAIDLWFAGATKVVIESETDIEPTDPRLKVALADTIELFKARLLKAIEGGKLTTAVVRRDFDENLIPSQTYIAQTTLYEWLRQRGYHPGSVFDEWESVQGQIETALISEAVALKAIAIGGERAVRHAIYHHTMVRGSEATVDESDVTSVLAALKAVLAENERLKAQLAQAGAHKLQKVDRPLHTRARRTLLTIIAALCSKLSIEPTSRGASQRVRELTEEIGAPVDDGTIAKALLEVPDALESRGT